MGLVRKLGDFDVSAIGLGCWAVGGPFTRDDAGTPMGWGDVDDNESIRAIHCAIDMGVTLFDTANNYGAGHSERVLGNALKGKRDKVRIATKFGSVFDEEQKRHFDEDAVIDAAFIRDALEYSLRRLQTDTIDLYQFHVSGYDPEKALEVRETLEDLVAEGKIRTYGWSTDKVDRARVFAEGEHCAALQHGLSVIQDAPDMLALCDEFDLASVNKKPLGSGFLTGKFKSETTFPANDLRHGVDLKEGRYAQLLQRIEGLRDVLTSGGRTMAQGALCWNLARSPRTIPIPGFKSVQQVKDNAGAMDFGPLTDEQMQQIREIWTNSND